MSTQRHSTWLRAGAVAAAVLLTGALTACGVGPAGDKDHIAKTTGTYLRAVTGGDSAQACAQLTPHARGDHCRRTIEQRLSRLPPGLLKRAADASLDISLHGNTATSTLGQPHGARLNLVRLGAEWRIDSGFVVPTARRPQPVAARRLVGIGAGRSLYLDCAGSGTPTVVLEAGFPGDSTVWRDVQPQLARTTRTCAYDRAGLGNSPPIAGVHDAGDEIADLQRLMRAARLEPPYVLVGHSYGGMLARLFAHEYPDETAGVVLVDARGRDATRRQLAIWPESEAPSVRRAVFRPVQKGVDLAASEAIARHVQSLGDTPLAVVTAARHAEWRTVVTPRLARALDRLWATMQDELASLSTDHVHVVALGSDHFIQRLDGQPGVVIGAVRAVVRAARGHRRLAPCERLFSRSHVRCLR